MSACVEILGVKTTAQTFSEAMATFESWLEDRQAEGRYACFCTVHTLMRAREMPALRMALDGASMVSADGMPLVWWQRRDTRTRNRRHPAERVYGPDVMRALCARTADKGVRHFLWGGAPGVLDRLAQSLKQAYPGLNIAGTYSPPFGPVEDRPDPVTIARLEAADPQVIWVGLGTPKQELWAALYAPVLRGRAIMAVGAAFDFLAGAKRQAPRWMQRRGLEWAFRLGQEPRRLGRRYLVYNTRFVLLAANHWLGRDKSRK